MADDSVIDDSPPLTASEEKWLRAMWGLSALLVAIAVASLVSLQWSSVGLGVAAISVLVLVLQFLYVIFILVPLAVYWRWQGQGWTAVKRRVARRWIELCVVLFQAAG